MSISDKLLRLNTAKNNIIASLYNKNIDASNHGFEHFANDIDSISTYIRLTDKTITENGSYTAANDNFYGYSEITANIHPGLMTPIAVDVDNHSYVMNGKWMVNASTINCSDIYEVTANTTYLICLGAVPGSRFRAMFSTQNTLYVTEELVGVSISNTTNPRPYAYTSSTPTEDGYITITKDNAGTTGIKLYVFNLRLLCT